jgi:oligopeptidase B
MTDHLKAPDAPLRPVTTSTHGRDRTDDFGWLRDLDDPATVPHLDAENAFTEASLSHLQSLREDLYAEYKGRIVETDLSVPVRRGPWWYYSRTEEGKSYAIHCRRPVIRDDDDPPSDLERSDDEQIIFDENVEAGASEFFTVGILSVSPDHSTLAVGVDTRGNERLSLSFRRLDGRDDPDESIEDISYGFAWSADSSIALFTRVDDAWRPFQLWRHQLGTPPSGDVLVLEEPDARFNVSVGTSLDQAVIIISIASSSTSEVRALRAIDPSGAPAIVVPRIAGVENGVVHTTTPTGDAWWLRMTNADGALDFELLAARDDGTTPERWSTLLAHREGVRLEDVDAFARAIVISERSDAETRVRVFDATMGLDGSALDLKESWLVGEASGPTTTWLGQNPEHDTRLLRFGQTSMTKPPIVAEARLDNHRVVIRKAQQVLGHYDPDEFVTYRLDAPSADGELVPVTLVHRRDLLVDAATPSSGLRSPAPLLLYGYGSYEISIDPTFSAFRLSILERGGVFAIAHIRGGGERGRRWYDQGHLAHKHNSFDDFVAVADDLIARGVTASDRLVARGGSAGGLLMGAVANQAPDRFAGLLAEVPFVDSLNTMLDPSLPLTVGEYEEWGNPTDDPDAFDTIASWAPYENVPVGPFPPMLLTGGLNDTRVGFWEPAKHAAKIRHLNPDAQVLLRMEMGVGHGGPSGRYDSWREEAFLMAWVLERLGLTEAPPTER